MFHQIMRREIDRKNIPGAIGIIGGGIFCLLLSAFWFFSNEPKAIVYFAFFFLIYWGAFFIKNGIDILMSPRDKNSR